MAIKVRWALLLLAVAVFGLLLATALWWRGESLAEDSPPAKEAPTAASPMSSETPSAVPQVTEQIPPVPGDISDGESHLQYRARVLSPSLEPIPMARVRVVEPKTGAIHTTDVDGTVVIEEVPYSFSVVVQSDGYQEVRQGVVRLGDAFQPTDLVLEPLDTAAIRGSVVDPRGRPLPRGTVAVGPPTGDPAEIRALTGLMFQEGAPLSSEGKFQLAGLPPGVPLLLEHRHELQTLGSLEVESLSPGEVREVELVSTPWVELSLEIVHAISGETLQGFTTAAGIPAHGILRYRWTGEPLLGEKTTVEKEVSLQGLGDQILFPGPGEVELVCTARGFDECRDVAPVFPGASATLSMIPRRLIEVEVLDESERPLRLKRDLVHRPGNPTTSNTVGGGEVPFLKIVARDPSASPSSPLAGDYNYGIRPPDRFDLHYEDMSLFHVYASHGEQVLDFHWLDHVIRSVPVGPDQDRLQVQLRLPAVPVGGLRFQVRSADSGEELGVFKVVLEQVSEGRGKGTLHYDVSGGEFFLERLEVGAYRLSILDPWSKGGALREVYWTEVEIADGELVDLGVLTAAPPARLEVLVVDESSRPVADASVKIWCDELESYARVNRRSDRGPPDELRTGADGSTAPILVRGGRCRLEASCEGYVRASTNLQLRSEEVNHGLVELRKAQNCSLGHFFLEAAREAGATGLRLVGLTDDLVHAELAVEGAGRQLTLPLDEKFDVLLIGADGSKLGQFRATIEGDVLEPDGAASPDNPN